MNIYSRTMTGAPCAIAASIERKQNEDRNIRANAAALAKVCLRIAEMTDAADFLGTHDGVSFLHSVHSMTGCDALYSLAEDCEAELQRDLARERAVLASVGSG